MTLLEWAALGAIAFFVLLYCARIMKRGLTTLDDDRNQYLAHMEAGQRQLAEDRKHISAQEQLYQMHAALADFLRLEDLTDGSIEDRGHVISIASPRKSFEVELVMRERLLASTKRMLHGRSRWILRGEGLYEIHSEMSALMASLNTHWHGEPGQEPEPDFVARRLAAAKRARKRW